PTVASSSRCFPNACVFVSLAAKSGPRQWAIGSGAEKTVETPQPGLHPGDPDPAETQALTGRALGQSPQILRMQPAQQRIAAHGLMIGLQNDRLAIRRHLDGAAPDALRPLPHGGRQRL